MSEQSVSGLVERLEKRAEELAVECRTHCKGGDCFLCKQRRIDEKLLREAASRLSSPEGTRCDFDIDWEALSNSPSSAPAAAPAKAHGNSSAEVERSRQVQLQALLVDIAQVFDGWHQDGTAWTTHDESVRRRLSEFMEASPRVSAATPAPEWTWNENQPPNGDTPVGRLRLALRQQPERLDDLRQIVVALFAAVSAAERPAQTCATCKWFDRRSGMNRCINETNAQLNNSMAIRAFIPPNPETFGCTLHEPAPPGPVAKEKGQNERTSL